jgi:5-methylcytosine-specific restriction enzyme subunit McrC
MLDMNVLYEQFLTVSLAEALAPDLAPLGQRTSHLDDDHRIQIRPDLSLLREGVPVLIGDAKYKLLEGDQTGHADLYQMLAYCTAEGIEHGLLVYPKWEGIAVSTVRVRTSQIAISRVSIDLSGSIADVRGEVLRLARWMHRLVTQGNAVAL